MYALSNYHHLCEFICLASPEAPQYIPVKWGKGYDVVSSRDLEVQSRFVVKSTTLSLSGACKVNADMVTGYKISTGHIVDTVWNFLYIAIAHHST